MGRVRSLCIENYRSIRDSIQIQFPDQVPLVLIGENNAGKSNIVRALDLVLGEAWPGSHEPEDHEYHGRDKDAGTIEILVELDGVTHDDYRGNRKRVASLIWRFPVPNKKPLRMRYEGSTVESYYVSNEVREQCPCIVVGADRRLAYQLSYASKYTFLSKLMKEFHKALTADDERVQALRQKFEEVKALFQAVDPFTTFTEVLQQQVEELSGNLQYRLGIDFSAYDPSNYFQALRVHPHENDQVRTFEELGTGQEQVLALSFAYAYAKAFRQLGSLLLVIEEPEAHLHPLAQTWVSGKVQELVGHLSC